MSPRKFNVICIAALIVVAALAMLMIEMSPEGRNFDIAPTQDLGGAGDTNTSNPLGINIGLGLSLALLADIGLMTTGLVILFKDDGPSRYRVR